MVGLYQPKKPYRRDFFHGLTMGGSEVEGRRGRQATGITYNVFEEISVKQTDKKKQPKKLPGNRHRTEYRHGERFKRMQEKQKRVVDEKLDAPLIENMREWL
jgi:hypothetical protein